MAKSKNHYYVLVFTNSGPKYVTSVDFGSKTARWDELEKPLALTKCNAEDLVFGLSMNFFSAVLVTVPFELDTQPYNYKYYRVNFTEREEGEENA